MRKRQLVARVHLRQPILTDAGRIVCGKCLRNGRVSVRPSVRPSTVVATCSQFAAYRPCSTAYRSLSVSSRYRPIAAGAGVRAAAIVKAVTRGEDDAEFATVTVPDLSTWRPWA